MGTILIKIFEIKKLGRLKYFFGIEVVHFKKGILILQQNLEGNLHKETRNLAFKPTSTQIDPNHKLEDIEEDIVTNREMHQSLVGRIIYFSHTD